MDKNTNINNENNKIGLVSEIIVNNSVIAVGFWTNKKKAQEDAAKNYCESLTSSWK